MPALWVAEAVATLAAARRDEPDVHAAGDLVRATVVLVIARLRLLTDTARVTVADLSTIVEAALIEQEAFDVAKALVMRRSSPRSEGAVSNDALRLVRRSGHVVAWNERKIEIAIRKAFLSLHADPEAATRLAQRVTVRARSLGLAAVPIEAVQDIVQEELVLSGQMRAAERYILYRAERAMLRAQGRIAPSAPPAAAGLRVLDADGVEQVWTGDDLRERIRFAATGLDLSLDEGEIEAELRRSMHDGIPRTDLDRLVVLNAKSLMERDADFSFFAGRMLLTFVYEETLGWDILRDGVAGLKDAHRRAFEPALERGVEAGRIDRALLGFDLDRLADALDPAADLGFDYLGLQTLYDRYLLVDKTCGAPRADRGPAVLLAARRDGRLPRRTG